MHSPVTSAPDSDKHASTKSCQIADGIELEKEEKEEKEEEEKEEKEEKEEAEKEPSK